MLLRRTRLGLLAAPALRTADSVLPVAKAMGSELGWDDGRQVTEIEAYLASARQEFSVAPPDPATSVERLATAAAD